MHESPLNAVIYARYSTDMQNPLSVRDQVELCRKRAIAKGWRIVQEYSDAGVSGTSRDRPGYIQMLRDMEQEHFDIILSESLDRLSRDQEDSARLYKTTHFRGVRIHTVEQNDIGLVDASLSGLMSALFLDALAQKTHRGLSGKIKDGKSAGGLSYGYRVPTDERGMPRKGEMEIRDNEAEVIRRIFTDYANGQSPLHIATALNDEGIVSPRSRIGSGGHWKQNTINGSKKRGTGILNNELYIGKRVWNRSKYYKDPETRKRVSRLRSVDEWQVYEVPHLRIVSNDLWDAVKKRQGELSKQKATTGKSDKNKLSQNQALRRKKYLLSGLLECGQCGGKLTIAGTGERRRYYCADAREKGSAVCDGFKGLLQVDAERLVLAGLKEKLMEDEAFRQFRKSFKVHIERHNRSLGAKTAAQDKAINQTAKKLQNILQAIEDGAYTPALNDRMQALEAELMRMRKERSSSGAVEVPLPPGLPGYYRAYIADLSATLAKEAIFGRASDELRSMIERIEVGYDKEGKRHSIQIEGNITAMLAKSNPSDADKYRQSESSTKLVAGVGFEPTTFRL